MSEKQPFETQFHQRWDATKGSEPAAWSELRKRAYDLFVKMGIPHRRTEEWKYTPLRGWDMESFRPALSGDTSVTAEQLQALMGGAICEHQLVFVNGYLNTSLSKFPSWGEGAYAGSLRAALSDDAWSDVVLKHCGRLLDFRNENPFSYLNQAMASDGAFLYIPEGAEIAEPLHVICVATSDHDNTMAQTRNLVVAGARSKVTLVESYVTTGEVNYWSNVTSSYILGEESHIEHYKVQNESMDVWHLSQVQVELCEASEFQSGYFGFGGATSRHEVEALLIGERAHCDLNGLTLPLGAQRTVNRICMEHAMPHCTSNQYYKSILNDKGINVFNGKIHVRQKAQRTDAYQTNQALLLSDDAETVSRPQLEIFADDVKCSHGMTSGYLDEESLFYLRSRGIGKEEAGRILTYAFACDLVERVKIDSLKELLEGQLQDRLDFHFTD